MVAQLRPAHDQVDLGTPFYAGGPRAGTAGAGRPVFHKYDTTDFVEDFLAEVSAAAQSPSPSAPPSMLPIDPGTPFSASLAVDVDALDVFMTTKPDGSQVPNSSTQRLRKLYQPAHYRFYLAACELRCLVPGLPPPAQSKIQKVEFVVRRVPVRATPPATPDPIFAWVPVPDPSEFPRTPPADSPPIALAPRLTGNTNTWWPMADADRPLEGEERFPMSAAVGPGLENRALYFGYLPLASGEMYGPRKQLDDPSSVILNPPTPPGGTAINLFGGPIGNPPAPVDPSTVKLDKPLIPAASNFKLLPSSVKTWLRAWKAVLSILNNVSPTAPRPKFEFPRIENDSLAAAWAYQIRCVATVEFSPDCIVEVWGQPSAPNLIAPHHDPLGGRPIQIGMPSAKGLQRLLAPLTNADQIAARGGISAGVKNDDCGPVISASGGSVSLSPPASPCVPEICFFGIPMFTIAAYIMFSIALVLMLPMFFLQFLFQLTFCIPFPIGDE